MKKILDLLEQKVQWIVFAAGLAYVGFMAWTYLISTPVKADVGGDVLPPGAIDHKILTTVAEELQVKMKVTSLPTDLPKAQQYVQDFKSEMSYGEKKPDQNLNGYVFLNSGAVTLPESVRNLGAGPIAPGPIEPIVGNVPGGPAPSPAIPGPAAAAGGPVEKLPALPAPALTHALTGLSNVDGSAPPPPGSPPPEKVAGVDKNWVTVRFEVDIDAIGKQWDQTKIPNSSSSTAFLQIVLTRQELMSDGSWGNETKIKPLSILNVPPFPAESVAAASKYEFHRWAQSHQPDVLQPTFYTVLKGDPWYIPGEAPPPVANPTHDFRPENYVNLPPTDPALLQLTMEQRRAVSALRNKQSQQQRRSGPAAAPNAPPPAGGAGNGIDSFAPNDPDRPIHYLAQDPIDQIDVIDTPVQQQAPGATRMNAATGAGVGKFAIPGGDFEPRKWATEHSRQPIIGWAFDDNATPGATYRYKVSYKLKNPVFNNTLAVKDPKLVDSLAIQSPDSAWSEAIDVASTVSFFLAGAPNAAGNIPVQIFRWKGGDPYTHTFHIAVGDIIGGVDGDVDYGTGWTVVDFAKNPASNDWIVLLMDQRGSIRRRTTESDRKDTRYQRMKEQVASGAAAAAAAP